jgi:predicted polyphosphate/ATP-dependent NAD kinase
MRGGLVGIVVNPLSGRDIRRLVAHASVFPNAEKANMVQRLLLALHAAGIGEVLVSTDLSGVSAAVSRAVRTGGRRFDWPRVTFVDDDPLTQSALDTINAVRRMVEMGAAVIICLGGDGTARAAVEALGEVPLLALSTGTNNVFPELREATVAGLAAGLVASGAVNVGDATYRASLLEVAVDGRRDHALVDVAVTASGHKASRAVWDPTVLRELYCTFAEPDAIGLSSIAGLLCPSPRSDPAGVALRLTDPAAAADAVLAPIAPGLLVEVGVESWGRLQPGDAVEVAVERGVIALDGEREIEFSGCRPSVHLLASGPRCVDVRHVLALAAARGLLTRGVRHDAVASPAVEPLADGLATPA